MSGEVLFNKFLTAATTVIKFDEMVSGSAANSLGNLAHIHRLDGFNKYAWQLCHFAPAQISTLKGTLIITISNG